MTHGGWDFILSVLKLLRYTTQRPRREDTSCALIRRCIHCFAVWLGVFMLWWKLWATLKCLRIKVEGRIWKAKVSNHIHDKLVCNAELLSVNSTSTLLAGVRVMCQAAMAAE